MVSYANQGSSILPSATKEIYEMKKLDNIVRNCSNKVVLDIKRTVSEDLEYSLYEILWGNVRDIIWSSFCRYIYTEIYDR